MLTRRAFLALSALGAALLSPLRRALGSAPVEPVTVTREGVRESWTMVAVINGRGYVETEQGARWLDGEEGTEL